MALLLRRLARLLGPLALAAVLPLAHALPGFAQVPAIAAAADLKFALAEAEQAFARATGHALRITYGSSGSFAQQIEHGAPFELFLSADEAYVGRLHAAGRLRDAGVLYGIGRLVLFVPNGGTLRSDAELAGLKAAVAGGTLRRFAIANPEHAPYGRAARQVLAGAGLWEAIGPRLVLGENAAQAAQFAASGNADGGMIPLALALAPDLAQRGHHVVLPAESHAPLRQRMALTRRAGPVATAFYDWLQTPPAQAILVRNGFAPPPAQR